VQMYRQRYPGVPQSAWQVIQNGYDEENFSQVEADLDCGNSPEGKIVLVHSGLLYPSERDPTCFFQALSELKSEGRIDSDSLCIKLRASGHDDVFQPMLRQYNIEDIVSLEPPVNYGAALEEMLCVDGLLIFQASNCNHQIPAKIYEYIRAKKPVFAMTDPLGDTAAVLQSAGIRAICPLDSTPAIKAGLMEYIDQVKSRQGGVASDDIIPAYSREHRASELAKILDSISK